MQERKHIESEYREHAIKPRISPSTSSHNSDANNNDIEKAARAIELGGGATLREDDAVTVKTWAVVVVSYLLTGICYKDV